MAHTDSNTTWGSIRAMYDKEGGDTRLISTCKFCSTVTEQMIAAGANAFEWARPDHRANCPIITAAQERTAPGPHIVHARPSRWERIKDVFRR